MKRILPALLLAAALHARDSSFDNTVADLEDYVGKRRLRIPLMGVISFVAGAARPLGVHAFKLAVIEDAGGRGGAGFEPQLGDGWRPVLRVTGKHGRESTSIYGRGEGEWVRMLMVTIDSRDAVVMQFRIRHTRFLEFIAGKTRSGSPCP